MEEYRVKVESLENEKVRLQESLNRGMMEPRVKLFVTFKMLNFCF